MGPLTCLAMAGRRRASPCTCTHTSICPDHLLCSSFGLYKQNSNGRDIDTRSTQHFVSKRVGWRLHSCNVYCLFIASRKIKSPKCAYSIYEIGHLTNCRVSTLRGGGNPQKRVVRSMLLVKKWLFGGSSPRSFISQPLFISSNHWVFLVVARGSPGLHMYLSVEG